MKYMNYLFCLISAFCLIHQVTSGFNLLAYGDVGQIDPWFRQSIKMKIAGKLTTGNELFGTTYANNIINEMMSEKFAAATPATPPTPTPTPRAAAAAAPATPTTPPVIDIPAKMLFVNFNKIFTCDIKPPWDSVVILGDGVYTENKGGYLAASFGSTYNPDEKTTATVADVITVGTKEVTDTSVPIAVPALAPGAHPQAVVPPPTPVKKTIKTYTPQKRNFFFVKKEPAGSTNISEVLSKRVEYASRKLYEMFTNGAGESCKNKYKDILPGNHSFDVDSKLETMVNTDAGSANTPFKWQSPFIPAPIIPQDGTQVMFLDINLMTLVCLSKAFETNTSPPTPASSDEEKYKNCILDGTNKASGYLITLDEANVYLTKLVAKLVQSKLRNNYDWRVIRTHGPIINPEIDLNGMLEMTVGVRCFDFKKKVKFDLAAVWTTTDLKNDDLIECAMEADAPKLKLWDILQKSEIDFWLASHYHAAMLVAMPFSRPLVQSQFNGVFINQYKPEMCIDRFADYFDKVASGTTVPHPEPASALTLTPCDVPGTEVKEKVIELMPKGPQNLLLEFIVGNSGRFLDPLKGDAFSNGDIIWARAKAAQYIDTIIDDASAFALINTAEKDAAKKLYTNQETFNKKVEEIAENAFTTYNNNFGYAYLTFEKTQAFVEFRETEAHTVVQRFKLIRRPAAAAGATQVHKIEQMTATPKIDPAVMATSKTAGEKAITKAKEDYEKTRPAPTPPVMAAAATAQVAGSKPPNAAQALAARNNPVNAPAFTGAQPNAAAQAAEAAAKAAVDAKTKADKEAADAKAKAGKTAKKRFIKK